MSAHESFEEFARAVHRHASGKWPVDIIMDGERVFYQRDDLYKWMMDARNDEGWPPEKVFVHLPSEVDGLPDRPYVPAKEVQTVTPAAVIAAVESVAPEYEGKFTYDDEE
jgi:hypothetical protein